MMLTFFKFVSFVLVSLFPHGLTQTYNEIKDALPERPYYGGVMGKYLNYPGLRYEPNVPSSEGLLRFVYRKSSTYKPYKDRMNSILSKYEPGKHSEHLIDCGSYPGYRPPDTWDKVCRFDLADLGAACTNNLDYGFDDGKPCILLSLERILNWLPEPYTNETVPDKIRDDWSMFAITVHCDGEDPVSKDNIGRVKYFPRDGFHFKYFPNIGQANWLNPLVAVQFENIYPAVAVRVTCTTYVKNMKNSDKLNTGEVSFSILAD